MASYIGSAAVIRWITSTYGTVLMDGDYRGFDYSPSIELLDETAGHDTNKQKVSYMKDGQATFNGLLQAGTMAGGTIMQTACVEGASGTLEWNLEGTATGKPKHYAPMISLGAAIKAAYNTFTEISVSWEQNGARVEGTN